LTQVRVETHDREHFHCFEEADLNIRWVPPAPTDTAAPDPHFHERRRLTASHRKLKEESGKEGHGNDNGDGDGDGEIRMFWGATEQVSETEL
jgi:hypothetical protein